MLAHHHFGNFTIDSSYLESHLAYEWEQNQDTYGMRVLSNPVQEDSIWMNGPPTWSYLQLALGKMPQAQVCGGRTVLFTHAHARARSWHEGAHKRTAVSQCPLGQQCKVVRNPSRDTLSVACYSSQLPRTPCTREGAL